VIIIAYHVVKYPARRLNMNNIGAITFIV